MTLMSTIIPVSHECLMWQPKYTGGKLLKCNNGLSLKVTEIEEGTATK